MSAPTAYIVDAVRTPVGKRGGSLADMHSADLGGHVMKALVDRTGIDPGAVDERGEHMAAQVGRVHGGE